MHEWMRALEGTWTGTGHGEYPTIESFEYEETVTLERLADKPILTYGQRTRSPDGRPLHAESGYFRFGDDSVELVLAQPTGIVEIHSGRVDDGRLDLRLASMATSPSAVEVTDVRRSLVVDGDVLDYELSMAAVGHGLTFHLGARLHRR